MLKVSRYNFKVPLKGNRALVYNSLSGATALLEANEVVRLDEISRGEISGASSTTQALLSAGFILRDTIDEMVELEKEYTRTRNDSQTLILTIAPTLACNFGCDYCFQGADKPVELMSAEVQNALVRFTAYQLAATKAKHLHVVWYGGEPLLGRGVIWSLSSRFMSLCLRLKLGYDAMIVTNGYHLSREVASELVRYQVKQAQITIDGDATYHNERRTLLGGQATFDRIVDNIQAVVKDLPLRISVRVNIDERNCARIPGLLHQFVELGLSHRKTFHVYFAPVEAITEGCHGVASVCMSKADYARLETELQKIAFALGLTPLSYPSRFRGLCGAVRPHAFVAVPNGDLHKCWDTVSSPLMRVGSVLHPTSVHDLERLRSWDSWTPFDNEVCRDCKLLPSCAGSCAHKFVNPEQTRGEAASLPCPSWKYHINERLLRRAVEGGVISEDDYEAEDVTTDPTQICSLHAHAGNALQTGHKPTRFIPLTPVNEQCAL